MRALAGFATQPREELCIFGCQFPAISDSSPDVFGAFQNGQVVCHSRESDWLSITKRGPFVCRHPELPSLGVVLFFIHPADGDLANNRKFTTTHARHENAVRLLCHSPESGRTAPDVIILENPVNLI